MAAEPMGVILAGGAGRRIGGSKAMVELHGRPLISYPLEAMRAALREVAILGKTDTELPSLPAVTVWVEPEAPRHPVVGILHALSLSDGRPVLICAADLPFLTPDLVRSIAYADPGRAPAVIAAHGEMIQPLLGCYQPRATELLAARAAAGESRLLEIVAALEPLRFEVGDPDALFNINTPDDLLQAAAMLDRRRASSRT